METMFSRWAIADLARGSLASTPLDSLPVAPRLPGGASVAARFLLQTLPPWVQWATLLLGIVATATIAVGAWRRRKGIAAWFRSRSAPLKVAFVVTLIAFLVSGAAVCRVGWSYMQHDNGFCTGCHIMEDAFVRFTRSGHSDLNCHECHTQSTSASMKQLYLWVSERPTRVGEHAPVSNTVCERCHVNENGSGNWPQIAATAGHRAHLESDSSALAGVQCVTCHAQEIHEFVPVDQTCAQTGCHPDRTVGIGAMAAQTALHCVTCHEYTLEVPLAANRDSAADKLTPSLDQCLSCHEMRRVLDHFDVDADPHRGTCGFCHKPHEQNSARAAATACATCHKEWGQVAFHAAPQHEPVREECTICHEPHRTPVDATDCMGCHRSVAQNPRTAHVSTHVPERLPPTAKHGSVGGQCTTCHQPHRSLTDPALCRECHSLAADDPPGPAPADAAVPPEPSHGMIGAECITCHEAHRPPADPVTCAECHLPTAGVAAAPAPDASAGRRAPTPTHGRIGEPCTTCHEPHQPAAEGSACVDCHELP